MLLFIKEYKNECTCVKVLGVHIYIELNELSDGYKIEEKLMCFAFIDNFGMLSRKKTRKLLMTGIPWVLFGSVYSLSSSLRFIAEILLDWKYKLIFLFKKNWLNKKRKVFGIILFNIYLLVQSKI